jgi:hypothetical protein
VRLNENGEGFIERILRLTGASEWIGRSGLFVYDTLIAYNVAGVLVPITVAETPSFLREAEAALTENERNELVSYLAANPEAGDIMPETGGARKLRWKAKRRGKSGGARAIYYYHNDSLPLFLLNVFAKNERANLSKAERNEMRKLLPRLIAGYRKRTTR